MNDDEALRFLRENQPLPDDVNLGEKTIEQYDEVRKHFIAFPNPACIPFFLGSFGNGDGFGVYQLVEDVLRQFNTEQVVPLLVESLGSGHPGVRYWNAQIAANYDDTNLLPPLLELLTDISADTRIAALTALEKYASLELGRRLRKQLTMETDDDVKELYEDVLACFPESQ